MTLLTGATGYIGGRLLRRLEADGAPVRCLCRTPEALSWRAGPRTEIVQGDLLQPASLHSAFSDVHTAFYLVHSMNDAFDKDNAFELREREAAINFATAARTAGLKRIIYLGGLAPEGDLSPPYAQPHRNRRHPAVERYPPNRVSRLDCYRFRQRLLRNDARACRPSACDDHSALGQHSRTACLDRRRNSVSALRRPVYRRSRAVSLKLAGAMSPRTSALCGNMPANGNCGASSCACHSSVCRCPVAG